MSNLNIFISKLRSALTTIRHAVVGNVSWQPPRWAAWTTATSARARDVSIATIKANPRLSQAIAAAVVIVAGSSYLFWRWYESQPKPIEITFSVETPEITCYGCEPPGKPNPLIFSFSESVAPLDRVNHVIEAAKSGVEMSPTTAGEWQWDNDRTLRFQPKDDWAIDSEYTVKFARKGFVAQHIRLQDYRYAFKTQPFAASFSNTEFYQDPIVAKNKKVVATVTFTHPVDVESFERHVKLKMFDRVSDSIEKEMEVPKHTVVFDKLKLNAHIHSDELTIPAKAGRLQIVVESGTHAVRGGNKVKEELSSNVNIPGLNSLAVQNVSLDIVRDERNEPHQVLLVAMSASVKEQDMGSKVSAWLLPTRHPDQKLQADFERYSRGQPYRWSQASVTPDVLVSATRLDLKPIPGEREHYELHSFRYDADPGRQVFVTVKRNLQSFGGYVLGENVERILNVPEYPRELSLLHEGSLLAMSGSKTLTVLARNVPAFQVEVGRLLPKQLQHLITQTGGSFSQPYFQNWSFDTANITERFTKIITVPKAAPGAAQYEALDLSEYLHKDGTDKRGVFFLRVQAWDPNKNQPLDGYSSPQWNNAKQPPTSDARLVVLTDLGMVVKRGIDGSQDVFVQSLHTGRPVAGATVAVVGANGLPVESETSDRDGHVHFTSLENFKQEKRPIFYLASLDGDSSFLPLDSRARNLNLSRFDVGGIDERVDKNALTAYLFSDRGIYRPGEQVRLGAIIRSQNWKQSLNGIPLRLEVIDPRGTVIRRETFTPGTAGFNEILHDTKDSSPTGTYTFALSIVRNEHSSDAIGSTTVQVREFLPDRLRMNVGLSEQSIDGWVSPQELRAKINLQNLFGTPAEKRRITAQLTLSPSFPTFRNFSDYHFFDPQLAHESFSERLHDAETDSTGVATFDLNLQRFTRATYRLSVMAEGFEADGGRGVTADVNQLVSNMPYLIGYKTDGSWDYLSRDSAHKVNFIAIDPRAQRTAIESLSLARIEIKYVSVLMRQGNGTYKYESRRKESEMSSVAYSVVAAGTTLAIDTSSPGSFAYVLRDKDGQQLSRVDYSIAGDANVTRKMDKNAELDVTLAKTDYSAGDDVELSIRAPYAGAGLITIERDRVYAWQWFKASTTSSVQHIRVPQNLEGNAYVSVTFVRDPSSDEIYSSPLSYGIKPFSINLDARRNHLTIDAPSKVKPGDTVKLNYKSERAGRIVIFAIDEGILQVSQYQQPNPLAHFFQKRALGVNTTQILDLLLPEFKRLGLEAATGGDAERLLSQHLNPFKRKGDKPVAYWSGILDVDNTMREASFVVPDYFNGSLRLMAVAVSEDRVGIHDDHITVRGDFVLSPNAPTTVSPGDEFDVSVGVANNVAGSGNSAAITVRLTTDSGLEVIGNNSQQIKIAEGHEDSVRFRLRARDQLGAQNLIFNANTTNGEGGAATRKIDLSLRPATPYMTQLTTGVVNKGGASLDIAIQRELYPQFRKLDAGVSLLPLSFAHGFVSYLGHYPYACTEQIVSQALPAIVLGNRPEFGYVRTQPGANLVDLLSELRARQNDQGAYKLWPGGDLVVEFASLYAQLALIEATERGERIPGDIVLRGNQYLRKVAARDGNNLSDERNSAFAIYLLARQGQNAAAEMAALRKRLEGRYSKEWPQDLTAMWLAASYELFKKEDEASRLIKGLQFTKLKSMQPAYEEYFDSMTSDALLLWITAKHFPERLTSLSPDVLTNMADRINRGAYMSLSAGTSLLALDAYATASSSQTGKLSITEVLKDKPLHALSLPEGLFPQVHFGPQAIALRFGNDSSLNAYYMMEQSGFDRRAATDKIANGMEVLREYTDNQGHALTKVTMGQEIDVHLKFRGLDDRRYDNIALVDLLPGGFELVVPRQTASTPYESASPNEDDEGNSQSHASYVSWQCQFCIGGVHALLQYADMREDRVVFYANINKDVQEIIYRIKATNVGIFATPPAYGEAMYDRSKLARSTSGKIEVIAP